MPELNIIIESPEYTVPGELGCSWIPEFAPVSEGFCTEEGSFLQSLQEPLPSETVESTVAPTVTDVIPPIVPVTVTNESPSATECVTPTDTGPDLSREGPFDARDAIHEQGQSPLVLDSMAGCQYWMTYWTYRMTSYEDESRRP